MTRSHDRGQKTDPTGSTEPVGRPDDGRDSSDSTDSDAQKDQPGARTPDNEQDAQQTDSSTELRCDGRARPGEPEPQRFAEVHRTASGWMHFADSEDPGRWITTDTVTEVTR
jgi:hypothetical protein